MKKVSIVIPMYNVENCITKCIASLINQTYSNIEILLIDDGSKDDTSRIIKKFMDERIKYIYQSNAGVSAARNNGINNSSGDYITFVDADDWLEETAIEVMVNLFENNDCDVIRTNYYNVSYSNNKENIQINQNVYNDYYIELEDILLGKINCYVWLIMLKRDCINKISFNTCLPMMEDNYFYFELIKNNYKIKSFDIPTYYYLNNPNGASLNINNYKKNIDSIILLHSLIDSKLNENEKIYNNTNITKCILAITKDVYKLMNNQYDDLFNNIKIEFFNKKLIVDKKQFNFTEKVMYFLIVNNYKFLSHIFLSTRLFFVKIFK